MTSYVRFCDLCGAELPIASYGSHLTAAGTVVRGWVCRNNHINPRKGAIQA